MKKFVVGVGIVLLILVCGIGASLYYYSGAGDDAAFFEGEIQAYEEADRDNPPASGGIVFVGSSSIRFWTTLEEDFSPLHVVNRGFGGAHFVHVVHNAPRIVLPYDPRAVIVYAGDNDIAAGTSVEDVVSGFREFVSSIHAQRTDTEIYYLSIKPSKLRWKLWPEMSSANARIEKIANADPRLHYLDVAAPLLNADGEPRNDVFVFDGLHLNATGYAAWAEVVRPILLEAFGD